MLTPQHPERMRTRAWNQEDGRRRPRVINEDLFRGGLIRERRRSDRSNQSFVLLLLDMDDGPGADSSPIWETVVEGLTAAKREMDVLGWFERRAVIGLIVPEIRASDLANACDRLDVRVRRELADRLGPEAVGKFPIRLHVYPEPRLEGKEGLWRVNSVFYPELPSRRARATSYEATKRRLDLIGSLTLLVVLSPLFLLVAILIKVTSRGPVFFEQVRVGQMMKPFTMLKFRTMYSGVDHDAHHEFVSSFIKAGGRARSPGNNELFKLTNDQRITPVGRMLRKTSLDELPQLWNVVRGDMSLVGPRPPLPYELKEYKSWHRRRVLEAKPGITGLWQVTGRSRTTFVEMVRLDLRYARRCSLWTDIKILLATPAAVISGKGAC